MHRDTDFNGQIEVIESFTSQTCSKNIKICLSEEESLGTFTERYVIGDTPTVLIFNRAKEANRLLGQAPPQVLGEFVSQSRAVSKGVE